MPRLLHLHRRSDTPAPDCTWIGVLALSAVAACSGPEGSTQDAQSGGTSVGGAPVGGAATGGLAAGGSGVGGASTGGVAGGGAAAGGTGTGAAGTGGSATGGVGTGATGAGGVTTGGAASGGVAGGGTGAGGPGTGSTGAGGAGVGGALTGGADTGGADTGGADTGGAGMGGAETGGASVGGADTGGTSSGGTATGGAETGGAGAGGAGGSDACTAATGLEAEFPECFALEIGNGIDATRTDAAIFVSTADIQAAYPNFNPNAFVVFDGTTELATQAVDDDPDGTADEIVVIANLDPNQTKTLTVRYATSGTNVRTYTQRAQALVSPKTGGSWSGNTYNGGAYEDVDFLDLTGHIDHDADYMRFEGPGWESDRIGHRVYMDRRNAIDIFGKKLPGMILQDIDYTNEDYSTMSAWGMDILHNGDALGLGSVGTWENGAGVKLSNIQSLSVRILASGPVYALLRMSYGGWQTNSGTYDVTADISITAGSRVSRYVVNVDGNIPNLCAGMPRHDQGAVMPPPSTSGWTHLATYGNQSLVPDALGLAVLYRSADEVERVQDSINQLVVLTPTQGSLTYYLLGAWAQEGGGLANQQQFTSFLEAKLRELDSPIEVTIL